MKKNILLIVLLLFVLKINVYAATSATEGQPNYDSLKSSYEKGITTVNVKKESQQVTLYGRSSCDSSGCTYNYANNSSYTKFEDVLKKTVVCSNGEKYIKYTSPENSSGGVSYKKENKENFTGVVYWSEDTFVTCTSTSSGSDVIQIENPSGNTGGNAGGNTGGNAGGNYGSATTTDPSATGVETYYIIIGLVGLITYTFMIIVKKYNLFKKI